MTDFDKAEAKRNAVSVKNLTECSFYERKNEMECKDFEPSIIQGNNLILKAAKRLKTFTLDDMVIMTNLDEKEIAEFLSKSDYIKQTGTFYEYIENSCAHCTLKIIDLNKKIKNKDITTYDACAIFLENSRNKRLKSMTIKAYRTFINAHIIPYFKDCLLQNISVSDIKNFKNYMKLKEISDRRIRNILVLLNQIIKHFQNEGYIERTCVFEVKRLEKIPKREIQILSAQQLTQLFKITKKKYLYLLPIIQKIIKLKQPLNSILTGDEQQINSLKRKIRKDFYKIKQEMNLENYMLDDLRSIDNEKLVSQLLCE